LSWHGGSTFAWRSGLSLTRRPVSRHRLIQAIRRLAQLQHTGVAATPPSPAEAALVAPEGAVRAGEEQGDDFVDLSLEIGLVQSAAFVESTGVRAPASSLNTRRWTCGDDRCSAWSSSYPRARDHVGPPLREIDQPVTIET
jgi:hypothetical protein